jgi:hypothetical protein
LSLFDQYQEIRRSVANKSNRESAMVVNSYGFDNTVACWKLDDFMFFIIGY